MLVEIARFKEIGGFDEQFFMYFEDNDLCLRYEKAGYRICIRPLKKSCTYTAKGAHRSAKLFLVFMHSMMKFLINGLEAVLMNRLFVTIVMYERSWQEASAHRLEAVKNQQINWFMITVHKVMMSLFQHPLVSYFHDPANPASQSIQ